MLADRVKVKINAALLEQNPQSQNVRLVREMLDWIAEHLGRQVDADELDVSLDRIPIFSARLVVVIHFRPKSMVYPQGRANCHVVNERKRLASEIPIEAGDEVENSWDPLDRWDRRSRSTE